MTKLIGAVVGSVLTLLIVCAGPLVWWWDRAPKGVPGFDCCWIIHLHHTSLKALDAEDRARVQAWEEAEQKAELHAREVEAKAETINTDLQNQLTTALSRTRTITKTLIKEVPNYVTVKADAGCVVPLGFMQLHDAAAAGVDVSGLPGGTSGAVNAASGVKLSSVAATVVGNYGTCNATRQQVIGWQSWYAKQSSAFK
jgi:hypothetical protein